MARYVTHFESAIDGTKYPADRLQTWHNGRPLWTRYDLDAIRTVVSPQQISVRPPTMWRYRELLPVGDDIFPVSLEEQMTPIVDCPRLGAHLGLRDVLIKDESRLPHCSFKARGLALATTMARHFGVRRIAMASNGNAGGTMAMYAARAGLESVCFIPHGTPMTNVAEASFSGCRLFRANGLIDECGRLIREGHNRGLWFDISTMKEPYRLEGKKTMGLELAEQLGWSLPDAIIYPTGGGTALIAMWKAFQELRELGWLVNNRMPRMISVQSSGCPPLVLAFQKGERFAQRFENASTSASGLRVPMGIGDFMVLDAIRESNGMVIASDESCLEEWQRKVANFEGIFICPETAIGVAALENLVKTGEIKREDKILVFNTAAGQKYMDHINLHIPEVDLNGFDWDNFEQHFGKTVYKEHLKTEEY